MQKKQLTLQQFVKKLSAVLHQQIWRVSHPADGWLFIDLGSKYQSYISDESGKEQPFTKSEYQLSITGDWTITQNGNIISSRTVKPSETQVEYFTRIETLTNNFPINEFTNITLSDDILVFKSNEYQLNVPISGKDDAISLTLVELSTDNKPIYFKHYRFDEELGFLVEVSSQ